MKVCRECWDPVSKPEDELCDWCKMTPAERQRQERWRWVMLIVALSVLVGCFVLLEHYSKITI